jgi:hypothetical protein
MNSKNQKVPSCIIVSILPLLPASSVHHSRTALVCMPVFIRLTVFRIQIEYQVKLRGGVLLLLVSKQTKIYVVNKTTPL